MMTTSVAISSDQAARYYRHYRRENAKEYYLEGEVKGKWAGRAAKKLGLRGDVSGKDFKTVLDGQNPRTGVQLVRGSSAAGGKRAAGWDVTFAAPKSVSLVALIGRDERVLKAHDEAVQTALGAIEKLARGRVPGRKHGDVTSNVVAALFEHHTSRDLDPHLHTHSVIVNMSENTAGKWVALDSTALFQLQRYGTSVYRTTLAACLLEAGYELRHGERGKIEIAGITEEQITHFSKRHLAMWATLRAEGRDDPESQQRVQRKSRRRKQHVNRAELETSWANAAQGTGIGFAAMRATSEQVRVEQPDRSTPRERAREAIDYAIAHTTEREAVVELSDIVQAALDRRTGYVSLDEAEREIERRITRGELVPNLDNPAFVTTSEMLILEGDVIRHLERSIGAVDPIAPDANLDAYGLTEAQAEAARALLSFPDRLVALRGVAGAGKTYTLRAVKAEAETRGLIVRGFAPTTSAARELAQSGFQTKTVAAHLASPGAALDRELWIVDEASLLATRQLHRLLEHAETARARLILIGDVRQHAGVEAGSPFRLLLTGGMPRASLDEIQRQRSNQNLLEAVTSASRGDARLAIEKLDEMGAVCEISDWDMRHQEMADRYAEAPTGTLIIAPSNKERAALNGLIRERLKERGVVAAVNVPVTTLAAVDVTGVQRAVVAQYALGQVVRYRSASHKIRIGRGTYATVTGRDVGRNLLTVRLPNGEERTYDPRRLKGVDVYAEESREISAGERIQFRAVITKPAIPNGALATILELSDDGNALIKLDDREEPESINLRDAKHFDYGYAVTSYSSQSKTVDRALVAARTKHAKELVNSAQTYVSISRARSEVEIFTDNRGRLPAAANRDATKYSALDFEANPGF